MIKHWGRLLLFGFALAGCSGWISELDTAFIEDNPKNQKPACQFKVSNNCWSRSVDLLQDCLGSEMEGPGVFSDDGVLCENDSGKTVLFLNSLQSSVHSPDQPLHFRVYNRKKTCFELIGNEGRFSIVSPDYGVLAVETLSNGDTQVNCFFGDSFKISREVKAQGCRDQKANLSELVPQFDLNFTLDERAQADDFVFVFKGVGASQKAIFQCLY